MILNIHGYQSNCLQYFQGLIQNKMESPRVVKKNSCGTSRGPGFWPQNFQGG